MPGYEIIGEEEKKEILEVLTTKLFFVTALTRSGKVFTKLPLSRRNSPSIVAWITH